MAAVENIDKLKRSITEQDQREITKWGAIQGESEAQIHREHNQQMDGTEFFERNVQKWVRMFKEGRTETSEGRGCTHNVHSAHEGRVAEIKRRMAERKGRRVWMDAGEEPPNWFMKSYVVSGECSP
ncbi:hypothetical protein V3C99_018510 [Haemonchus contortus]|uniref:Histone-lysine N-methyltransferase SETMAR n=1 Tax=Haemonchus contortus TaxID=6289 RepID=A0A7I4Z221_HAECO